MWFRTTLDAASFPGPAHRIATFQPIDDRATVYLNGKKLHEQPNFAPFYVDLDPAWRPAGPNVLVVLVEDVQGRGGFMAGVPDLLTSELGEPVAGAKLGGTWRMRGGVGEPNPRGARWNEGTDVGGAPAFFRSSFTLPRGWREGAVRVLRVGVDGLSRGFVWVNGQNLGRYPEAIKAPGLYVPEPWLRDGANELVVFDEDGASPQQVRLSIEQAASRAKLVARPAK
jgi:beta-galactosidase